jgi:hypothetical protein
MVNIIPQVVKDYPNAPWNALWAMSIIALAMGAMDWWVTLPPLQMIAVGVVAILLFVGFTIFVGYMKQNYGTDILGWIKDMAASLQGQQTPTDTPVVVTPDVPVTPSVEYPVWPGVSYISYQGTIAAFMDIASYKGAEIKGYPVGKRYIPIITKYGEEMQGRFCPDDGVIYKVGDDSVFDDERAVEAKAYAVLKSKVIDTFNRQCPVTYNGNRYVSATGGEYDQLILPYVKSLGLTEQQYVDKFAAVPPVIPAPTTKHMLKNGGVISAVGLPDTKGDRVVYYIIDGKAQMTGYHALGAEDRAVVDAWIKGE